MKPRVYVDFNEMVSADKVLLSNTDAKTDSAGNLIVFYEGMVVDVYMDDQDEHGVEDDLIASGVAVRNTSEHWPHVPWLLKIDGRGIRHRSDEPSA